jgi:hypothetical protein
MKVVLSVAGLDEGTAGQRWCLEHLARGDTVIAVLGVNPLADFVLSIPPLDALDGENELLADVTRHYCVPLNAAGIACEPRLLPYQQGRAVMDVARAEHADLIVAGKRPHGRLGDIFLEGTATQVVHHPPCPVVVVPTDCIRADATETRR